MKTIQNQKAEIIRQFASGEIDLQELKATSLGIGLGGVHFCLKGFEHLGCLDPVQIDEVLIPGEKEVLAPCEGAYFYDGHGIIIIVGGAPYDNSSISDALRKPSTYAHIAVLDELGTRSPSGTTPEQEAAKTQKIELEITSKRTSLRNILNK